MIEMVTKISQAEEAATQIKKEAQQKAMQLEAEAHKAGKATLVALRAKNEAEAAKLVEAAQTEAAQLGSQQLEAARGESRTLSDDASTRINKAASLIVERIVETE